MLAALAAVAVLLVVSSAPSKPIALDPANPHYFVFRGKPTILITSAEHYGAVLNPEFDFIRYLNALKASGLNYTRIFTGAYCENPADSNIQFNTLAPRTGRLMCPWARSDQPGYANGGNRFDLNRWDPAYFRRLTTFVAEAGRRGIVVEVSLFCTFYSDTQWNLSPMKASNNVNGVGAVGPKAAYTLKDRALTAVQDRMTRKIVRDLAAYDNVFFEICNEPYFGGVTLEWQRHTADVIADEEKGMANRHLIAQNIGNGSAAVKDPHPAISILNFHYCSPPDAVRLNRSLNRVVAFDETGFRGHADQPYRTDAWDFIVAGGGLYNNLDYSFTVAHPDGTQEVSGQKAGGGGASLRAQLAVLKKTIDRFDFLKMQPADDVVKSGVPSGASARVLAEPGKAYLVYLRGGAEALLSLDLPAGAYRAKWIDTKTGAVAKTEVVRSEDLPVTLSSPQYSDDIALTIVRAH